MSSLPFARPLASGLVAAVALGALVAAVATHDGSKASAAPRIQTASATLGTLRIGGGYIPQPANPAVAAAYFKIANSGSGADTLLSVSSDASKDVGLHKTIEHGTTGTMVPVASLVVPAGGSLAMAPGGNHVMLEDPSTLTVGKSVSLTLHFARAGEVTLRFPVVPLTATNDDLSGLDMTEMTDPASGHAAP